MAKGFMDGYRTYDTSQGFGNSKKWQSSFEERLNLKFVTVEQVEAKRSFYESLYDCKTAEELKKQYRKLMQKHHPDIAGDTEENKIIAQAINDIYFTLKSKFK